jgi:hypothetical protein
MLIGDVRVSKSDGTQTVAPQLDAMLAAGVDPARIYEDLASGRPGHRIIPGGHRVDPESAAQARVISAVSQSLQQSPFEA